MSDFPGSAALNRIEKRAIEASAIAPFMEAVSQKIGKEQAMEILLKVSQEEAFERGRRQAKDLGRNGIAELVEDVATWGDGGVMELDILEQTDTTYFFNVTRCPYYDKYRELGLEEYGVGFSCCRDEPFARGFNPRLRLVRTGTIMEGADCCDFRYSLEDTTF